MSAQWRQSLPRLLTAAKRFLCATSAASASCSYFYPKDDTPGCTTQACGFRDNYPVIEEKNAVVLGVSPDSAKSHTRFKTKFNLPFTLLVDEDHAIAEALRRLGGEEHVRQEISGHRTQPLCPSTKKAASSKQR
jgi:peroxiredoxin